MSQDPILHSFALLAKRTPLATLLLSPERRATVADVDALARAAATRLAPAAPGAVVGLVAANGPGLLASLLAVRRAGHVALLLDAQAPAGESRRIAGALGATALLHCRCAWPRGAEDWNWTALAPTEPLHLPGLAVLKLTSGSTGAPRGIATPSAALVADDAALTATMGITAADRLLATVPLAHSFGLSSLVLPALLRGTPLVFPAESNLLDPFAAAHHAAATVFPTVPAYLDALLRTAEPAPPPASLRLVLTAGAPLSAATSRRFHDAFGLPVHVFYGASECGGICYDREGGAAERGTVGSPVDGVRIALEGDEESGAAGVVRVESAAVAQGYVPAGSPRLGGGRFLTGDLATLRGGELALLGRTDDLVNVKGKKVSPREVESVLAALPGVLEAAVLGTPRPDGAGDVLRAVVACQPGALAAADVTAWCRAHLSPHKVPRSLLFVERLPRTSRGKLDRAALLALAPAAGEGR